MLAATWIDDDIYRAVRILSHDKHMTRRATVAWLVGTHHEITRIKNMSEEAKNTTFTFDGAGGATYDDFDYSTVVPAGEYRARCLKAGYHEKEGNVTLRISFGVHALREGAGPRVDTYVAVTPGKQRSQLFRSLGFAEVDQQTGKFTFNADNFRNCECFVTLGQEKYREALKNNVKNMRPINLDGRPVRYIEPQKNGATAAAATGGDDSDSMFG